MHVTMEIKPYRLFSNYQTRLRPTINKPGKLYTQFITLVIIWNKQIQIINH